MKKTFKNKRTQFMALALTLLVVSVAAAENIVKEGAYTDRGVWMPKMVSPKTGKLVDAPEILSIETEDLPEDLPEEIGMALKVSLKPTSKDYSHVSGLQVVLNRSVPKDAGLKVSFWAKSISGSKVFSLRRCYGASGSIIVKLSDRWTKHDATLSKWDAAGSGVCVTLVKRPLEGFQPVAKGEFMIADLVIEELPKSESEDK